MPYNLETELSRSEIADMISHNRETYYTIDMEEPDPIAVEVTLNDDGTLNCDSSDEIFTFVE